MSITRKPLLLGLFILLPLAMAQVAGCGGAVNMSNYEKVKDGMSQREVESILGKGIEAPLITAEGIGMRDLPASAKLMAWGDGRRYAVFVAFVDGRVVSKQQKNSP
jgi:hypothetical protein